MSDYINNTSGADISSDLENKGVSSQEKSNLSSDEVNTSEKGDTRVKSKVIKIDRQPVKAEGDEMFIRYYVLRSDMRIKIPQFAITALGLEENYSVCDIFMNKSKNEIVLRFSDLVAEGHADEVDAFLNRDDDE